MGDDDLAPIRTPCGMRILRRLRGELLWCASRGQHFPELPTFCFVPCGEGDPIPVRRPRRRVFEAVLFRKAVCRQSAWLTVRQRLQPDASDGLKRYRLAVRCCRWPAQETGHERVVGDAEIGAALLRCRALHTRLEGDRGHVPAVNVEALDLASLRDDHCAPVRGPRISGHDAERLHALGRVLCDRIHDDPLGTRFQVAQPQGGAGPEAMPFEGDRPVRDPSSERQPTTVGRDLRRVATPARAPNLLGGTPRSDRNDLPSSQILPPDLPRAGEYVSSDNPRASVHVEEEVPAVR